MFLSTPQWIYNQPTLQEPMAVKIPFDSRWPPTRSSGTSLYWYARCNASSYPVTPPTRYEVKRLFPKSLLQVPPFLIVSLRFDTTTWIPFKIPLLWLIYQWNPIIFFCHLRCRAVQRDKSQTHYYYPNSTAILKYFSSLTCLWSVEQNHGPLEHVESLANKNCTQPEKSSPVLVLQNCQDRWKWGLHGIFLSFLDVFGPLIPNLDDAKSYLLSILRFGWKKSIFVFLFFFSFSFFTYLIKLRLDFFL